MTVVGRAMLMVTHLSPITQHRSNQGLLQLERVEFQNKKLIRAMHIMQLELDPQVAMVTYRL